MTKLRKTFSKNEWNNCCGKFCESCEIANAYRLKFEKKEAHKKFKKDRKKVYKKMGIID
jgi:hypothetical protein